MERLFDRGSAVHRVLYTTNALESVNSSFRLVTRKDAFPNEQTLLKPLYLRVTEQLLVRISDEIAELSLSL